MQGTIDVKEEVKPKIEGLKCENIEGVKSESEEDDKVMTSMDVKRRRNKYSEDLIQYDIKMEPKAENTERDVLLFRIEPGFWKGLQLPEQTLDDDDAAVSEASGEGESLISASDFEPEDEFNFCKSCLTFISKSI